MLKIPPDYTFVVQIVIFVALWLLLKRFWFDPTLRLIAERRKRSEGAVAEARAIQADAERLRAEHAAALDHARAEAQREMQAVLHEAEVEHRRLIDAARDDTRRMLEETRAGIATDVSRAREALRDSAHEIARVVAEKVLGRTV